jgi:hypothetical protein
MRTLLFRLIDIAKKGAARPLPSALRTIKNLYVYADQLHILFSLLKMKETSVLLKKLDAQWNLFGSCEWGRVESIKVFLKKLCQSQHGFYSFIFCL